MFEIVENKHMSTKAIAKCLETSFSTDFRHHKKVGFKKNGKSKRCHFPSRQRSAEVLQSNIKKFNWEVKNTTMLGSVVML